MLKKKKNQNVDRIDDSNTNFENKLDEEKYDDIELIDSKVEEGNNENDYNSSQNEEEDNNENDY